MRNAEIVRVFKHIAALLELKRESRFKIRAYQQAALSLKEFPDDLTGMVREGRLREVPGVGEALATKITELVTTGQLRYYENLKAEFPAGIVALLDVPGIGPKTAEMLNRELGIISVDELEAALDSGRLAALPHIREKTVDHIRHGIQTLRQRE